MQPLQRPPYQLLRQLSLYTVVSLYSLVPSQDLPMQQLLLWQLLCQLPCLPPLHLLVIAGLFMTRQPRSLLQTPCWCFPVNLALHQWRKPNMSQLMQIMHHQGNP